MYLRGFGQDSSGGDYGYDYPDVGLPDEATTWPSTAPPTSSSDWTGVISQAIRTWGDVTVATEEAHAKVAAAPYSRPAVYNPATGRVTQTAGASGVLGLSLNTWILVAAVVAAILLMRKG